MIVKIEIECKSIADLFAHLTLIGCKLYKEKNRLGLKMVDEDLYKADSANLSLQNGERDKHTVEILPF